MFGSKNVWAAALVAVAGLVSLSCNKDEKDDEKGGGAVISIFAENDTFNEEGAATVNLAVSGEASGEIVATIAVGSKAEEGFTAVSAEALTLENSIKIAKGTKSVSLDVKVDFSKVSEGQEAVITIASATGAKVDETAGTAYIKVPAIYKGETPVEGSSDWSIIGSLLGSNWDKDFVADEVEGVFVVKNVQLNADSEFKFRFQKDWAVNRGGAFTELGKGFACAQDGDNVKVGAEGIYDIYYNPGVEQIGVVATGGSVEWTSNASQSGTLNWNIEYKGTQWVPGYYSYGELEVIAITETGGSFYHLMLVDLSDGEDYLEALTSNHEETIAALQNEIEDAIADEMDYYGETREEAIPEILYKEENDGSELYFYGQPAGEYQFVILSANDNAELDGGFAVVNFSKTTDAQETYDWGFNPTKNNDWTAAWDGWYTGYEGKYYWAVGTATGVTYIYVDTYTDEEIDEYLDGDIVNMFNSLQTNIADALADGTTAEELAEQLDAVDESGNFETLLNTYGATGATNAYILGIDAEGKVLNTYGVSEIVIPEVEVVPVEWSERTDWALNYDPTVDTEDDEYNQAVVTTVCDAEYFVTAIYDAGIRDAYSLDEIGDDALYYVKLYSQYGYTVEDLCGYGLVHKSVPAVEAWKDLSNGMEAFIFGITADGKVTGEWHSEPLTGIEEVPGEEFEMVLQSNWSVTTVGSAYKEGEDDVIDIEVNCPGILWYSIEENTQADLDYYYGGSIQGFAQAIEEDLADYLGTYTMDELLYSGADPMPSIYVYNFDTPTTIYIVEFDENGKATGRYGATAVTIPSGDTGGLAVAKSSVRHPALRHSGLRVGKNLQHSKPEARRPVLGKKVRKAVNLSAPKLVSRSSAAAVKPASKKIGRKAAIVK